MAWVVTTVGGLLRNIERKVARVVDHVRHGRSTGSGLIISQEGGVMFSAPQGSNSPYLPSTRYQVRQVIHMRPKSFVPSKGQLIGIADGESMAVIRVNVTTLGIGF